MDIRSRTPAIAPSIGFGARLSVAAATVAMAVWGSIIDPSPVPGVLFALVVAWAARDRRRRARAQRA